MDEEVFHNLKVDSDKNGGTYVCDMKVVSKDM